MLLPVVILAGEVGALTRLTLDPYGLFDPAISIVIPGNGLNLAGDVGLLDKLPLEVPDPDPGYGLGLSIPQSRVIPV